MADSERYFNFVPANNKIPCGGFNVVGGGIIGKDYYDVNTIKDMYFQACVDEKDCHIYEYTDSSNDLTSTRMWSNKVKIAPLNEITTNRVLFETFMTYPQGNLEAIYTNVLFSLAKCCNAKDMLNFYFPALRGMECIGAIEDNDENQANGHLAFAKYVALSTEELMTELKSAIKKDASISDHTILDRAVDIEQIDLVPRNMPSEEDIASNLDKLPNGLCFYLDGVLLIADTRKLE